MLDLDVGRIFNNFVYALSKIVVFFNSNISLLKPATFKSFLECFPFTTQWEWKC